MKLWVRRLEGGTVGTEYVRERDGFMDYEKGCFSIVICVLGAFLCGSSCTR